MTKHLLALLLLLPALSQAQNPIPFTVKGKIGQLGAPAKIYLVRGQQILDSATFQNGAFTLKGTTDMPQSADLLIKRDGKFGSGIYGMNDATRVYLEAVPVVVTSPDSLRKARVTGGPVTADDQRLQASFKPLIAQIKALGAQASKASEQERQSAAFGARMQAQYEAVGKQFTQRTLDFIKVNPKSWVSLEVLSSINPPQYAEVAPLYNAFSPALKNSPAGRRYGEMLQGLKAVAIGQPAPAISQQTPEGKTVALADYRGKYVLIDFWASWCGPCRQENPAVTKVYQEFKSRNFEILGVSLDDEKGRAKWVQAIADDQLAWPQVSDLRGWQNEAARRYQVQAIPQNFLIDPTGKIVAANLRGGDLRTTLAKFIK